MADVTVLGLGTMGSALARALVAARHQTTVWNRNPAKVTPLVHQGALPAETVRQAISGSPLIIVCVDSYATTRALLLEDDVSASLSGRTVVQLSTGSPREAEKRKQDLPSAAPTISTGPSWFTQTKSADEMP